MIDASLLSSPTDDVVHVGGVPAFVTSDQLASIQHAKDRTKENDWKNYFKKWPRFYEVLVAIVGPSFFTGLTSLRFVKKYPVEGMVLHAGSGTRRLPVASVNVDMFPFSGVDAIADVSALPFTDGAFAAVTCDQVLEHVPQPYLVARELMRVTKTGGLIHVASPFLFPWHPSPSDFTRWTREGLAALFPGCTTVETGVMAGPCSAMTAFLAAFFATLLCFGSRTLQGILQYVFLILFAPIKVLDLFVAHIPGAELCAANFYIVLRKDHEA